MLLDSMFPHTTAFIETIRPAQLCKTILVVCWGSFCHQGNAITLNTSLSLRLLGACLIWAGLYCFNDLTDEAADRISPMKQTRALPSGRLRRVDVAAAGSLTVAGGLVILGCVDSFALFVALGMIAAQLAYTVEPFRFKRRPLLDVISGAVTSTTCRFLIGYGTIETSLPFLQALMVVTCWKVAAYLLYRLEEYSNNFVALRRDTVATLSATSSRLFALAALVVSLTSFLSYAYATFLDRRLVVVACIAYVLFGLGAVVLSIFGDRAPRFLRYLVFSARAN